MAVLPIDRGADVLIALYEQAERELRVVIRSAAARGAAGTAVYYARQRRRLVQIIEGLRRRSPALAAVAVRRAYDPAATATSRALGMEAGFTGQDQEAVAVLAQALAGRLDQSLLTVGRQADDALRRGTLEEAAKGLARGDDRRRSAARLRDRLADEGTTGFVDRAGRRWRLGVYASMAVRTTTREATTLATMSRLEALGHDLVAISKHAGSCSICLPFQGRTYSRSGESTAYPRVTALPPFHPQCRHLAHPATVTFEQFERDLGLAGAPRAVAPAA